MLKWCLWVLFGTHAALASEESDQRGLHFEVRQSRSTLTSSQGYEVILMEQNMATGQTQQILKSSYPQGLFNYTPDNSIGRMINYNRLERAFEYKEKENIFFSLRLTEEGTLLISNVKGKGKLNFKSFSDIIIDLGGHSSQSLFLKGANVLIHGQIEVSQDLKIVSNNLKLMPSCKITGKKVEIEQDLYAENCGRIQANSIFFTAPNLVNHNIIHSLIKTYIKSKSLQNMGKIKSRDNLELTAGAFRDNEIINYSTLKSAQILAVYFDKIHNHSQIKAQEIDIKAQSFENFGQSNIVAYNVNVVSDEVSVYSCSRIDAANHLKIISNSYTGLGMISAKTRDIRPPLEN